MCVCTNGGAHMFNGLNLIQHNINAYMDRDLYILLFRLQQNIFAKLHSIHFKNVKCANDSTKQPDD